MLKTKDGSKTIICHAASSNSKEQVTRFTQQTAFSADVNNRTSRREKVSPDSGLVYEMASNSTCIDWMKLLPAQVKSRPLRSLSIPGTHDSGAYKLNEEGPLAPDTSSIVTFFARGCACIKTKVKDWSLTQDLDITQQLGLGVRYIDLRTAYREDKDSFEIVHGLYGVSLSEVFEDLRTFVQQHDGEVIILDFQEFFDFTAKIHARFAEEIDASFGKMIASASKCDGANTPLEFLQNRSFNFVVIYRDEATAKTNDFWSSPDIMSPWPNTDSATKLAKSLYARFESLKPGALNVFQAVLTPQSSTVILRPCSSLKTLAVEADAVVSDWLQQVKKEKRLGVNIVICDFAELDSYVQRVIELNIQSLS